MRSVPCTVFSGVLSKATTVSIWVDTGWMLPSVGPTSTPATDAR